MSEAAASPPSLSGPFRPRVPSSNGPRRPSSGGSVSSGRSPCMFFSKSGGCRNGSACPFEHVKQQGSSFEGSSRLPSARPAFADQQQQQQQQQQGQSQGQGPVSPRQAPGSRRGT